MHAEAYARSFAAGVGIDPSLLDQPGTTVVAEDSRHGNVAWYQVFDPLQGPNERTHTVLRCDRTLLDRVGELANVDRSLSRDEADDAITLAGGSSREDGTMRVIADGLITPAVVAGYRLESLDPIAHEADAVRIQAFVARCDSDEVAEEDLDDLGTGEGNESHGVAACADGSDDIVAYSSAIDWPWDGRFRDIGILVRPEFRSEGIGRLVVAASAAQIIADGLIPLYRHEERNRSSSALAQSLGFARVANLSVWHWPAPCAPADEP